ncbi:MAG TPA: C4-dicarboxylic acid transporter DauA [Planctomycetota bacterium]
MGRALLSDPTSALPLRSLPAAAFKASLRGGYTRQTFRSDLLAGLVVGVVALPLSMALAINAGAPPQHGLYTAIIAGFVVALLGGSRSQVTGPTAAFIPILLPISTQYGLGGLLLAGLMGGLILIGMGLMRLGKLIEYIPYPVTTGFTAGIAVVIATLQLKDLFGLSVQGRPIHYFEQVHAMWAARGTAHVWDFAVGAVALLLLIVMRRATQKVPGPLIVLPLVALGAWILTRAMPDVHITTVASKFQGGIPQIPPMPALPWHLPGPDGRPLVVTFDLIKELVPGAFAVAMLGAIESLLSAVVADGMARTKHEPDAEILALGVGNVICPFFGGIPATGAIARTATNIRSGGKTPVASMVHSATILAVILLLAPLIGHLPMAALAALLLIVAWNMSEAKHVAHMLKVAPGSDRGVLVVCFALTVAFDMVISVSVGVVLAALLFMKRMADLTKARLSDGRHTELQRKLPEGVVVYDIAGPLFFGAAQRAMSALDTVEHGVKAVVFDLEQVPAMDATGLVAFESSLAALDRRHILTVLTEMRDQPRALLAKAGVRERFPRLLIRPDLETAVQAAEDHAAQVADAKSTKTRVRPA